MANIAARMLGVIACALLMPAISGAIADQPKKAPLIEGQERTCLPHDGVDSTLSKAFGEKIVGQGISSDGTLLEIFMAPAGNFTVIKTSPEGTSCVVDFGDGWRTLNQLEQAGFTPDDL